MKRSISGFAVLLSACISLSGQWLKYPTAGLPRTPDGKPNLSAPAPKTADGKPDLSGIWDVERAPGQRGPGAFVNIGPAVKDGLPYKPEGLALKKARTHFEEPLTNCLPMGIMEMNTVDNGTLRKIVQIPGLVLMLHEWNVSFRQIFTDGRPFPADMQPAWNGYSIGKWDGDTLVVQTTGFRDGGWLDTVGDVLTDAGKITEKFHRSDFGHMQIEITVDDPKAYTMPWTFKLNQILVPDTEVMESICAENEKDLKHIAK
jgi:hypothetical protein